MANNRRAGAGSPVLILGEDSQRTQGRDAQSSNITAGKAIGEAVRTTLGPRGMDKMLVDSTGEVVITNDGVSILKEMDIEHPAAQMLVEVAETQESEVGDGTTTAAVIAGELLAQAEKLLERDVHPTAIVEGYVAARDIALEAIDEVGLDAALDDELLTQVAKTSITGTGTGDINAETLAKLSVRAIRQVQDVDSVRRNDVRVHAQSGASSSATDIIEGVVIDDERLRNEMPDMVEDATIAVLDAKLEARETSTDVEYTVTDTAQLNAALDAEEQELRAYADELAETGVDVLVCTKDIEGRIGEHLARHGILAYESVDTDDARAIASATGAVFVGDLRDIEHNELGHAETVRTESYAEGELTFIEGGSETGTVTVFVRGSTTHVLEELERALSDTLDVVALSLDQRGVVPGAGCTELVIADRIREGAASVEGRAQLAAEAFADAIDIVPRTLASNTGMDPIDALVELRAATEAGRAGVISSGETGEIADPVVKGVLDPAPVKRDAIESATEAATMIIRIDDIIAAE